VYVSAGTAETDEASLNNTPRLNKTVSDGLNHTPRVHPTQLQAALQQIGGLDMHMGVPCAKEASAAREEARDTTPSTSLVYDGKEKLGNVISIHGDWGLAVTQLPNSSVPLNESNQMKDAFTVSDNSKWSLDDGTKVELYLPSYI
jgi:hypothetical protein